MTGGGRCWAAFDFDGTLVPGDSLPLYLARLLGRTGFVSALARSGVPMATAYRSQGRDGAKAVLLERAVSGVAAERARSAGEAFAAALADRIRPSMADRLEWHRSEGHQVVLVSASLELYLTPFAKITGFDRVIATRLEVGDNGLLTGRLAGANVRAEQKAVLLRELIGDEPVTLWAYGDSRGDREMLAMADHPTLLRRPWRMGGTGRAEGL